MAKTEFVLTPAVGKYFVGRKDIIRDISKELKDKNSHVGFCLYGRRRVGKTSVLMELKYLLHEKKDIVVAYLSLYDIADLSMETFADEIINAVISAYQEKNLFPLQVKIRNLLNAPLDVVLDLLKNTKLEATVFEHIRILIGHAGTKKENYSEYIRHAINTAELLAKATSTKCVLILDEFPEILNIENGLQLVKMLRTQYEIQKRTALVISGSIKKTLEAVALADTAPFYKQLVPKHLLPFTEEETLEFLKLYLGKIDKMEAKKLHQLTSGLPFYLQFIGRSTKYSANMEDAIQKFIDQEGSLFFREEFEKISEKEKLIVVALSGGKMRQGDIAKKLDEQPTTIGRYLPMLMDKEIVAKESRGTYYLIDNLFSFWVKQKYGRREKEVL